MKSKKDFTLIELLAIIVILAIIAVITVPIILGIISNSKKGAIKDSAYGYKAAIEKFYLNNLSLKNSSKLDGLYYVADDDLIHVSQADGVIHNKLEISGKKPSNGYLNYSNNKIVDGCLLFDEYAVTFRNGELIKTEKDTECEIAVYGNLITSYITPVGESATKDTSIP